MVAKLPIVLLRSGAFSMRRVLICIMAGLTGWLLLSTVALASKSPADYPLRVHIFHHNAHSHYYHRSLDEVDGEGRANLYEGGMPYGFDFSYHCGDRLMNSMGFETYFARWKKPGKVLEVLLPVMGKPGAGEACDLDVVMKNAAYYYRNGVVMEEPQASFKEWMDKHQYDPEHGLNEPVKTGPEPPMNGTPAQQ
jgi:hypothetical protein